MKNYKIYRSNINDVYINNKLEYLMKQKDIIELIINSDVEADYQSLSLSGTMIRSNEYLYPVAAGFDIGCGLGVFKTDVDISQINISDLFDKNSPFGIRRKQYKPYLNKSIISTDLGQVLYDEKLGCIEQGNHFIEIRVCENSIYIIIHSGVSENVKMYFAQRIISFYRKYVSENINSDNTYKIKVQKENEVTKTFVKEVEFSNQFAKENRKYIAERVTKKLRGKVLNSFDSSHEYIRYDGKDIVHCNGTQEYKDWDGVMSALILSGFKNDNYIVERVGQNDYINHGTVMLKNNDGERIYSTFEDLLQMEQLNVKPIYKLSPICGCKKGCNGYEYCIL